ncbi:C1 family peptidase [Arthrobacter sp. H35-D1]|uniref:C1 family peptidase n=1 Tax=Arthrobacter sp. H35-D1 TaxID=3046202 RepID=UPI0024BA6D63|nr:C1 family peptidase [Arthrobacter sp. H35-D1]MDJ0313638.1 C1 family peptidase [Arthrobacter sp. H35-D1]
MARTNSRYGWIRDLPDQRDFLFAAPHTVQAKLPPAVDLVPKCPPVYDQGRLGSCTGNGVAGAVQFDALKEDLEDISVPSRLFIYYNERVIEGSVDSDAGAQIRDGIKTVAVLGVCDEALWPYDITKFTDKPPATCYTAAKKQRAIVYSRAGQTLSQLKGCLASGYPIVFGFSVYDSFESAEVASTGVVPMPAATESVLGGHCVVAVGYDDAQQRFTFRNSWGESWGNAGYGTMPYAYLLSNSLASDFWTVKTTS